MSKLSQWNRVVILELKYINKLYIKLTLGIILLSFLNEKLFKAIFYENPQVNFLQ